MGVCRLDRAGHLCEGCGRTLDEIGEWAGAGEDRRRAIAKAAAGRIEARSERGRPT